MNLSKKMKTTIYINIYSAKLLDIQLLENITRHLLICVHCFVHFFLLSSSLTVSFIFLPLSLIFLSFLISSPLTRYSLFSRLSFQMLSRRLPSLIFCPCFLSCPYPSLLVICCYFLVSSPFLLFTSAPLLEMDRGQSESAAALFTSDSRL